MRAMVLDRIYNLQNEKIPLHLKEMAVPEISGNEVLLKVLCCGVCHTELDEIEGRTPPPLFPVIPGHQVIGEVVLTGEQAGSVKTGDRVGVGWLYDTCGVCKHCLSGNENLCTGFKATGRDVHGGYAEYMVAPAHSVFPVPKNFSDQEAAPLLCAGAIGYRSMRLSGIENGRILGLSGFGASAHLVMKMIRFRYPGTRIFVFARSLQEQAFAMELGADWAGDFQDIPPAQPDCIIDTTPVWKPVVAALKVLSPGGRLIINAIRKEDPDKDCLSELEYTTHLWLEKEIKSVANVSRKDIREFLELAAEMNIRPEFQEYPLEDANIALLELKDRKIRGAKVLRII